MLFGCCPCHGLGWRRYRDELMASLSFVPSVMVDNVLFMIESSAMDGSGLKQAIEAIGITQADLARLLGVTARAVNLWAMGDRPVPGPVEAYTRLLQVLTPNLRQAELSRLHVKEPRMRNGMYGIYFKIGTHPGQSGVGMLNFEDGVIYGVDEARVRYDGGYTINAQGQAEILLKVTYPPNVIAIFGTSNPYEWSIEVQAIIDPNKEEGDMFARTSLGQIIPAHYTFMRPLPQVA